MKKLAIVFITLFFVARLDVSAQDELMDLLGEQPKTTEYTYATFKTTRVINSQSVENPAEGVLMFLIQHRFGRINTGGYEFFGSTRLPSGWGWNMELPND